MALFSPMECEQTDISRVLEWACTMGLVASRLCRYHEDLPKLAAWEEETHTTTSNSPDCPSKHPTKLALQQCHLVIISQLPTLPRVHPGAVGFCGWSLHNGNDQVYSLSNSKKLSGFGDLRFLPKKPSSISPSPRKQHRRGETST